MSSPPFTLRSSSYHYYLPCQTMNTPQHNTRISVVTQTQFIVHGLTLCPKIELAFVSLWYTHAAIGANSTVLFNSEGSSLKVVEFNACVNTYIFSHTAAVMT